MIKHLDFKAQTAHPNASIAFPNINYPIDEPKIHICFGLYDFYVVRGLCFESFKQLQLHRVNSTATWGSIGSLQLLLLSL